MNIRSRGLTYAGVVCIIAGFGVIAFVWGRVAALTAVPLQLPYIASGGFTALGLILVGILLINIQTKLADATRRDRQIQQLGEVLEQIRAAVLDEPAAPSATDATAWPTDAPAADAVAPDAQTDASTDEAFAPDPSVAEAPTDDASAVDASAVDVPSPDDTPESDTTPSSEEATTVIPVVRVRSKRRRS